ncbi:unnamed protein product [Auanema sp. JU1783]|nr:unnamed protein product [Auanema sp. JU1783]
MQGLVKVPVTIRFSNTKPAIFTQEGLEQSTANIEEAGWVASVEDVEPSRMNLKITCNPINCTDFYFDEKWQYTADLFLKINTKDTGLQFTNQKFNKNERSITFNLNINEIAHLIPKPSVTMGVVIIVKNLEGLRRQRKLDFLNRNSVPFCDMQMLFPDGTVAFLHRAIAGFNSPVLLNASEVYREPRFNYSHEMENVLTYWYDQDFKINRANVKKMFEIADFFGDVKLIEDCKDYLTKDRECSITFLLTVASSSGNLPFFCDIVEEISSRSSFKEEAKQFMKTESYLEMSEGMKLYLMEEIVNAT